MSNQQPPLRESASPWEDNFREQMAKLREARQMSQSEMARRLRELGLRFHQQTVQKIESGERPVRLNEAHQIASVLRVDLEAMTMPTDSAIQRRALYAVGGTRRAFGFIAIEIIGMVDELFGMEVAEFAMLLKDNVALSTEQAGGPDVAVGSWMLAWGKKIVHAYDQLRETLTAMLAFDQPGELPSLGDFSERGSHPASIQLIRSIVERYEKEGLDLESALEEDSDELYSRFPAMVQKARKGQVSSPASSEGLSHGSS